MFCVALRYVYGWLATINLGKVSAEAREAVKSYRRECYEVLYDHFTGTVRRLMDENEAEIRLLEEQNELLKEEKAVKARRRENERQLEKLRSERLNPQPRLL